MIVLATLALAAAAPTAEAERLGREVAESGTLAAMLPLAAQKDRDELIAAHPELSDADKARLRRTGERVFEADRDRIMAASGHAYAERLSLADLRAIAAFNRSGAAKRYQAAMPLAIAAAMQSVGTIDLKGETIAAFCRETGKLCDKR